MSARGPAPEGAVRPDGTPPPNRPTTAPRQVDSRALFAGASELHIAHAGQLYRLRRTALGKLILTK